ncbi:MAG TPA: hypothetical protein VLK66_27010 [Longimicrobium sp.]|nr:hypothetical protein [Longimicrobium sp.]
MQKCRNVVMAGFAMLLLAASSVVLNAQGAASPPEGRRPRVPVTVVLQDTAAPAAGFRIIRRVDQLPRDVILLTGSADAETLSEAVRNLLMVRMAGGDTAVTAGEVRVRRAAPSHATVRPYPWAERVLRDLHAAPPQEVAGIGLARAVQIWFPPQHHRAAP